jgi:hypothetical protein
MRPFEAHIAPYKGKPALHLNGEPVVPSLYALTDCPGGRYSWEEVPQRQIRKFGEAGIRLFQLDLWFSGDVYMDEINCDLDIARRQIRGVVDACPGAAVMFRLHVNSSKIWNLENPDECVRYADAGYKEHEPAGFIRPVADDDHNARRHSLASGPWRAQAEARCREFMLELAATPEGDHVFGIQVAGGVFGEWHQWGLVSHEPDISPAMLKYFRNWLKVTYGTTQALSSAWGREIPDMDEVQLPSMADRFRTSDGIFRDPAAESFTIDYYRALQSSVVDAILPLCKSVKESWPRPLVTGTFYGYFKFLFGRHATGGHLEVERYLASDAVDFLASPQTYPDFCRGLGGTGESRGLLDACRRAGKLCLDEMDQVTSLGSIQIPLVTETVEQDRAVIRRNVLQPFTYGMGHWYYDFGPFHQAGAWDHPFLMETVRELHAFQRTYFHRELDRCADTLVVYDPESLYHVGNRVEADPVSTLLIDDFYAALLRSGAIFEDAWLFELEKLDLSRYRTVIFANTFVLSAERRQWIRNNVCADGRHVIWNYLPGYSDGRRLSLKNCEELIGMDLELHTWDSPGIHRVVEGLQMGRRQGFVPERGAFEMDDSLQEPFPAVSRATYRSTPYPVPAREEKLEILCRDPATGHATVFSREFPEHTSWLCAAPLRDPLMVNALLAHTPTHLVNDVGDTCYAGQGCLMVHTGGGGDRTYRLPTGLEIRDCLPPDTTRMYDLETGKTLLR